MYLTVVGVDPGYRNLGIVALRFNKRSRVVSLHRYSHIDVGAACQDADIITRLWEVLDVEQLFADADYVVIETQNFGRRNTNPVNQGIAWLLATTALSQSEDVKISFLGSMKKFSTFKKVPLPYKLKRGDLRRRSKIKANSIYLATKLMANEGIAPEKLFKTGKSEAWEHLADAINLAFVGLKRL